jgi:hypothetical protein
MKRCIRWGIFLLLALPPLLQAETAVPRGFAPAGSPARYGTPDRKLADGSIFDFMDGGGIVYLDHGFRELVHREFQDPRGRRITFDRFTMATPAQALAALADARIAPGGGKPLAIAAAGQAYRFPPDYFIYMVLDGSLLYLHVDDDALAETLDQFAADILKSPKEEKE